MKPKRKLLTSCWPLKGTKPTLYTKIAADVIVNKSTGKEYIRGELILVRLSRGEKLPKLIEEDRDKWEFVFVGKKRQDLSIEEMLQETYTNILLKE